MPTNLPPEYFHVEKRYKEATTPEEKLSLLEELISTIPKHKGTDHLRSDLRRKLSKMKESALTQKKSGGVASVFQIDSEGVGQCVVIGCGNTGKSSLVAKFTNADPDVAEFPFSTWQPTPGSWSRCTSKHGQGSTLNLAQRYCRTWLRMVSPTSPTSTVCAHGRNRRSWPWPGRCSRLAVTPGR